MVNALIITLLLLSSPALADERHEKETEYADITQLAPSFTFSDPGLYEIKSKQTGNIIYLYVDRAGNVEIEVLEKAEK